MKRFWRGWRTQTRRVAVVGLGLATAMAVVAVTDAEADEVPLAEAVVTTARSLDGSGNNVADPTLGQAGMPYSRIAEADYADGIRAMVGGPSVRYISNRVFNDSGQNIFSDDGVSHWAFVWGQFLDHTIGLRDGAGSEEAPLVFDPSDPLEEFTNDLGVMSFIRSAAADGTGVTTVREQTNLISSFIDASVVYGSDADRLDWLRSGERDGDPTNNDATLLSDGGYLPTATARDDASAAPTMEIDGALRLDASSAVIAGDVRANENIGLTAVQTLFMREHNRIVELLPDTLSEEAKFQIARRVIGAELQWITYNEFLPAMGVELAAYTGYEPDVDPSITNEFAAVAYRAHSMIHGRINASAEVGHWSAGQLEDFVDAGIEVTEGEDEVSLAIPLNIAYFRPWLLPAIGLDPILEGLATSTGYANDEQIDNQLRSVLFQIPGPDVENPADCLDGADLPDCFGGVVDLGALDVARGRDHGIPSYNELRAAYGLDRVESFTELTGESTAELPPGMDIDDPAILEFVELLDGDGEPVDPESIEIFTSVVTATRASTLAARLAAIYGDVDEVDAFVGLVSEPHAPGTEMGELQMAMWRAQFTALRDGDRYFYGNDPLLDDIAATYGIDFRRSLAEIIADNSDAEVHAEVFFVPETDEVVGEVTQDDAADQAPAAAGDGNGRNGPARGNRPPPPAQAQNGPDDDNRPPPRRGPRGRPRPGGG